MKRGFIRTVRGRKAKKQEAELQAAGVEVIYDDLPDAVSSLRSGDQLVVYGGLHVLSPSRGGMDEIVQEVHSKGCVVLDIEHNQSSAGDGVPMLAYALDAVAYEKRFGDPVKAGKKGAASRWAGHNIHRSPKRLALGPWMDRHLLTEQALAHDDMKGWTRVQAYRELGNRGILAGRFKPEK